jgi:hypothetical protein
LTMTRRGFFGMCFPFRMERAFPWVSLRLSDGIASMYSIAQRWKGLGVFLGVVFSVAMGRKVV